MDNAGNRIPIGFNSKADYIRMRDGVRAGNRTNMASPSPQDGRGFGNAGAECHVEITDNFCFAAGAWPAKLAYRNVDASTGVVSVWIYGEACMVVDLNDADLIIGRRYKGQLYQSYMWNGYCGAPVIGTFPTGADMGQTSGPHTSFLVIVNAVGGGTPPLQSSSSGSASKIEVVTDVNCDNGGLHVTHKTITGYVTIAGSRYPVTFNLS